METKRPSHVEVYLGRGIKPWRYRVRASNGEITSASQGYPSKANAMRAARKLGLRVVLG